MADRIVFIVWYCSRSLKRLVKSSKNGWIAHEMGSICHSKHHLFQTLSYVVFVPLLHPAANSLEALLEISFACCLCLIVSKRLIGAVLLLSEDVDCQVDQSRALGFLAGKSANYFINTGYHSRPALLESGRSCPPWPSWHTCPPAPGKLEGISPHCIGIWSPAHELFQLSIEASCKQIYVAAAKSSQHLLKYWLV